MENLRNLHKERFYKKLNSIENRHNSFQLSANKINSLIADVKSAKDGNKKKENRQYWLLKHYDVLTVDGRDKLIFPLTAVNGEVRYYCSNELLFDILYDIHIRIGHGGRDRMVNEVKSYKNITQNQINLFLSFCEVCQTKKNRKNKGVVVKPIFSTYLNSRAQIDLIDFQSNPDGNFKFILIYQDHLTKYVVLRALESKAAAEIAMQVFDIFLMFGAPCILQSDNSKDFCCLDVIKELKILWPELSIVHGKPRNIQSQGNVDAENNDVQNMVALWMKDKQSTQWSLGIKCVQFSKNRLLNSGLKKSPYKAMFGCDPQIGLESVGLPSSVFLKNTGIIEENEFERILSSVTSSDPDSNEGELHESQISIFSPLIMSEFQNKEEFRVKFYEEFEKISSISKENSFYMDELLYDKTMREVREAKEEKLKSKQLTEVQRRRLARFDIAFDKLIANNAESANLQYFIKNEEMFDVFYEAHEKTSHGGRDRMLYELKKKYKNATQQAVLIFVKLCVTCQLKSSSKKKGSQDQHLLPTEDLTITIAEEEPDEEFLMGGAICVICSELIDPACSLLSPCCEKTWTHPNCLEISSKAANQSFKCPACTVKDEYQECEGTLNRNHLHGDEDSDTLHASVKVEVECCADECLCDEGRMRSRVGTQWEVVVCDVCTSAGTHKRCSNVQLLSNQWHCLTCRHITVNDSCDVPRENPDIDAGELLSYLPHEVCKTELTEDAESSANPEILKNDTILPPKPGNVNESFEEQEQSDSHSNCDYECCGEKPYKCYYDNCTAAFNQLSYLKSHRRTHTKERPYKCEHNGCGASFSHTSSIIRHRRTHTNEKPYKCDYDKCKAAFAQASSLKLHRRRHTKERPYKCDYDGCNRAFTSTSNLTTHRRTHTNEKPYKCDHDGCDTAFSRVSTLQTHRLIHTNEKPHKCDYDDCDAAFSQSSGLILHRRTHTKEKPYKCDYDGCGAAFISTSNLKTHLRAHTNEKPYKCHFDGCNSAFTRSSTLKMHRRIHADKRP